MQEKYDGMHLTEEGKYNTDRFVGKPNLDNWSVESTVWFNPKCLKKIKKIKLKEICLKSPFDEDD